MRRIYLSVACARYGEAEGNGPIAHVPVDQFCLTGQRAYPQKPEPDVADRKRQAEGFPTRIAMLLIARAAA